MKPRDLFLRIGIPVSVFVSVWALHYVWHGLVPEGDPEQAQWVQITHGDVTWWDRYVSTQSYWLGYSYALSLAFAAHASQQFQRNCYCVGRKLTVGVVTLAGFLAVAGCFLIGCCGSPMLAVYLSLFGTAFIPLAKPLVAVITSASIIAAWFYLHFRNPVGTQCSGHLS